MSLIKAFKCILILAIAILLIGLPSVDITNYVQSTITSKFIVFTVACLVLFGGFIAMYTFSKQKPITISKIDTFLFFLVGYITLNRYGIQPIHGFSIRFFELLGLVSIYILLRNLSRKAYMWLLLVIIISGIIQAIYGNLQLLGYYPSNHSGFKFTGSFFNPGPYTGFLVAVWPIALGMYLFKEKVKEQIQTQIGSSSKLTNTMLGYVFEYIPLLGVISIVLVIPSTYSRGGWLAILLSSLVLLEFRYHFIKNTLNKINKTKKGVLIILTLCLFFTGLFGTYHFKKESADGRLFIWKVSTEIVKDFAVTGVGFDRFKAYYMNYQADYFAEHGETQEALVADNTYYAFNDWLQFSVENGLVGVVLLFILLSVIFKLHIIGNQKYLYVVVCNTFLAIGIFAFVSYPMQILPIKLIIVILLFVLGSLEKKKWHSFSFESSSKYAFWMFKTVVFILSFIGIYKGMVYTKALDISFKQWQKASTNYQYGDYKSSIEQYAKAYTRLNKEGDFLMNYGKALSMVKQNKKAMQILEEAKRYLNTTIIETALGDAYKGLKQYNKAEIAYKRAANMIPVRFYPLYLQAKLYEENEENDKAIAMANTILNKKIKIPSTAIKEIKAEMKKILTKEPLGIKN